MKLRKGSQVSHRLTTTLPPGPWLLTDTPIHCNSLLSLDRSSTKTPKNLGPRTLAGENGAGVDGYLTRVVKLNSGAIVPVHVAAVQPSGYLRLLSPQSLCSRGTNQQSEAETPAG